MSDSKLAARPGSKVAPRPTGDTAALTAREMHAAGASIVPTRDPQVHDYLSFRLAGEAYALPLGAVRELLKVPPLTEVPRTPPHVLGIISVRGRITTILDLRERLNLPRGERTKHTRILLVDSGEEVLGLLVDRVLQVHRLLHEEIEPAVQISGELAEHVRAVGRPSSGRRGSELDEGEILILLDPGPLLRRVT